MLGLKLMRNAPSGAPGPRVEDELAELVTRARAGDERALRTLLVSLGPPMLQVIRRVLGRAHPDVEDAFQDATIALVRALKGFRGECTARHFGCRIAAFTAITARRRRGALPESLTGAEDEETPGAAHLVAEQRDLALTARRREIVRALLEDLPAAQAEALVLHCIAGLTVTELAGATRVPIETARSRLRLAKAALRLRIAADPTTADLREDEP